MCPRINLYEEEAATTIALQTGFERKVHAKEQEDKVARAEPSAFQE